MKKRVLIIAAVLMLALLLCACGKTAEEAPAGMTSELPGANLSSEPVTQAAEKSDDFKLAESFIGQPVENLIATIGEPVSSAYTHSCLGEGDDGNLEYDGFFVYTYKDDSGEVVKDVYQ